MLLSCDWFRPEDSLVLTAASQAADGTAAWLLDFAERLSGKKQCGTLCSREEIINK